SNATRSPSKARTWPPTTGSGSTVLFFFSSRRRHTRWPRDWSSDVCSSDLPFVIGEDDPHIPGPGRGAQPHIEQIQFSFMWIGGAIHKGDDPAQLVHTGPLHPLRCTLSDPPENDGF